MSLNVVEVHKCFNDVDAEIIKGMLEENGIEVFFVRDDCGGMEPQLQITEGIKILVPYAQSDQAGRIIEGVDLNDGKLANQADGGLWECSNCNEKIEPQFTDCWNCGTARP